MLIALGVLFLGLAALFVGIWYICRNFDIDLG